MKYELTIFYPTTGKDEGIYKYQGFHHSSDGSVFIIQITIISLELIPLDLKMAKLRHREWELRPISRTNFEVPDAHGRGKGGGTSIIFTYWIKIRCLMLTGKTMKLLEKSQRSTPVIIRKENSYFLQGMAQHREGLNWVPKRTYPERST